MRIFFLEIGGEKDIMLVSLSASFYSETLAE